jgi:hypothetical protein
MNWLTDSENGIGSTCESSKLTGLMNNILKTFFPNAQIITVSNNITSISTHSRPYSKSDRKIRNSLTNIPEGGMAVIMK